MAEEEQTGKPSRGPLVVDADAMLADEFAKLFPGDAFAEVAASKDRAAAFDRACRAIPADRAPHALCLSGGGIRSATFALGVLQGLHKAGRLERFSHLSTVSGGGYIGAWLSRWQAGDDGVPNAIGQALRETPDVVRPPDHPIRRLRGFSSYLSPSWGFSVDTLTAVTILLRNLLFNWLVWVPVLLFAAMLPRALVAAVGWTMPWHWSLPPFQLVWLWFPAAIAMIWAIAALAALLLRGAGADGAVTAIGYVGRAAQALLVGGTIVAAGYAYLLLLHRLGLTGAANCRGEPCHAAGPATLAVPVALAAVWAVAATTVLLVRQMTESLRESLSRWGGRCLLFGIAWAATFLVFVYLPGWLLGLDLHKLLGVSTPSAAQGGATETVARDLPFTGGLAALVTIGVSIAGFWSRYGTEIRAKATGIAAALGNRLLDAAALLALLVLAVFSAALCQQLVPAGERLAAYAGLPVVPHVCVAKGPPAVSRAPAPAPAPVPTAAPAKPCREDFYGGIERGGWGPVVLALALALFAFVASMFVGNNRYSLHALYGNRLVRAYLGSARRKRKPPNRGTDFDAADNIGMAGLLHKRPFHVVNMTLNLARPTKTSLDWQERKGTSFTATPLLCGSPVTGYMAPGEFDGEYGMTLGRAMTISGAAASPNMGFHSSPLVTLLLTLWNVRLGWWVRNPQWRAPTGWRPEAAGLPPSDKEEGSREPGPLSKLAKKLLLRLEGGRTDPLFALYYALKEATSGTGHESAWLYLSDGGHFDNLGLYEMVRRRCRRIVVVDAGCDGGFQYADLMTAVRLVSVDLAVPIELPPILPGQDSPDGAGNARVAVGRIRYSALPGWQDASDAASADGEIFIVKPILLGNEPPSLQYYREISRKGKNAFPHHSTLDQFFDESQFESYRALGEYSTGALLAALDGGPAEGRYVRLADPGTEPAKAPPSLPPDIGSTKLALALLAAIGTLGIASGVGSGIATTIVSDRQGVVEHEITDRITSNDPQVLAAMLRLIDLLEKALAERPAPPAADPRVDPQLIIEIRQLIEWLRTHPDRTVTVNLDPALLRKISDQIAALAKQSEEQNARTFKQLRESKETLEIIARDVPATGPRRNIRSGTP